MNRVMLWVVTGLAVAFLFFPSYVGALFGTANEAAITQSMNRAVFQVDGMTCEGCATTVAHAIRQVPGIVAVEVSYETRQAVVGSEASGPIPATQIIAALKEAGYEGQLIEARDRSAPPAIRPSEPGRNLVSDADIHRLDESVVQTVFQIEGMTCAACASALSKFLANVSGITSVTVDFEAGRAYVQHPACCPLPNDAVMSAVETAGFKASLVADSSVVGTSEQISLFEVPLQCAAAPHIGCGSRAKPILLELERDSQIAEAWLNHAGTVLAVVGPPDAKRAPRAKTVQTVFAERDLAVSELDGDARERMLIGFQNGDGWHRGAGVDRLSKQKAGIIANRLVRRLRAKVSISEDKADALKAAVAEVFERRFVRQSTDPNSSGQHELLEAAQRLLENDEVTAFKETLASGYRPQPGEE